MNRYSKRIRVTLRPTADHFATKDVERIIEFTDPVTGKGGLISIRRQPDGNVRIEPYCLDPGVVVIPPK